MNKIIKFFVIFILFFSFIQTKHAADVNYTVTGIESYNMGKYSINRYQIGAASDKTYAYCLSPKKYNYTYYTRKSIVDPKKSLYNLALVIAYTYMINKGAIDETDEKHVDDQDGGTISTVFRLISEYYGRLSHIGNLSQSHIAPYLLNGVEPDDPDYFPSGSKAAKALKIFQDTIKKVKNTPGSTARKKFQRLQKDNFLWYKSRATFKLSGEINVVEEKATKDGKYDRVKFKLTLQNDAYDKKIDSINWKEFKSTNSEKARRIKDTTPICNCGDTTKTSCTCEAYVRRGINSFKMRGSITTNKNTINRMEILEPTGSKDTFQELILVDSSATTINPEVTIPRSSTVNPECTKVVDGSSVTYFGPDGVDLTDDVEQWREDCVHICQTPEDSGDGNYYCSSSDPDQNGPVCDYATYRSQCDPIKCEREKDPVNPNAYVYYDASGSVTTREQYQSQCVKRCTPVVGEEDSYYCADNAEHDPDLNGTICSYDDYYHQCIYCGKYEDFCTKNPTGVADDGTSCSTYWLNCPNCNPSVSIPSTCIGFDEESVVKGTISDINIKNTDCNHSVKAVKGCVIGGQDISNNSYVVSDKLKDNKLCRIYCYEEYSFNLPTAKHSNSGGYFNLQMSVTGTRHCYLGSTNMIASKNSAYASSEQFEASKYARDITNNINNIKDNTEKMESLISSQKENKDKLNAKENEKKPIEAEINRYKESYKNIFDYNSKLTEIGNYIQDSSYGQTYNFWKRIYEQGGKDYEEDLSRADGFKMNFDANCADSLEGFCKDKYQEIDYVVDLIKNYEENVKKLNEITTDYDECVANHGDCHELNDEKNTYNDYVKNNKESYNNVEHIYDNQMRYFSDNCYNRDKLSQSCLITFSLLKTSFDTVINSQYRKSKNILAQLQPEFDKKVEELDKEFNDSIEQDSHYKKLSDSLNKINGEIEELKTSFESTNSELKTLGDKMVSWTNTANELIDDLRECTTIGEAWTNDMNFDPVISYEYTGYSRSGYNKGTFKQVGDVSTSTENKYCYSRTNGHYECDTSYGRYSEFITNNNDVPKYDIFKDVSEDTRNARYYYKVEPFKGWQKLENGEYQESKEEKMEVSNGREQPILINLPVGIEKVVTKTATYAPSQNFETFHQYGTIVSGEPCSGLGITDCLYTRLPETALPVELKTGRGAFPFNISVSNIGQYGNDNNKLGRLVGNTNSVLNTYNKEVGNKCSVSDEQINGSYKTNFETLTAEVGYVCGYINNCDSCGVSSCSDGSCELECSGSCKMSCKNCIYDGNNSTFKYRTVSINNIFPNTGQRNTGYNWSNYKGQATMAAIQDAGDSIYESASYSYTLTPAQLKAIRDYNRTVGTYSNTKTPSDNVFKGENALKCEQMSTGNITYSVKCLSTFLNVAGDTYFTTNARDTSFTLWTESDYCKNNACPISREDGIGLSWK